jgi:hypothetical protein
VKPDAQPKSLVELKSLPEAKPAPAPKAQSAPVIEVAPPPVPDQTGSGRINAQK